MTSLILNVKQLRFQFHTEMDDSFRARIEVKGEGEITGADLIVPSQIEVINPELHLLTADSNDVDLDIEMVVSKGRGYSPAEDRGRLPIGEIPVDAVFSPVQKANFEVTRTRVGQMTDYDRLVMEVWTDGSISPDEALSEAARILVEHLSRIAGLGKALVVTSEPVQEEAGVRSRVADVPIEELDLSVRAYNCLKRAGIVRVGEVLAMLEQGEDEIMSIRNFGRKSLDELLERLQAKGYLEAIDYRPSGKMDDEDDDDDDDELDELDDDEDFEDELEEDLEEFGEEEVQDY